MFTDRWSIACSRIPRGSGIKAFARALTLSSAVLSVGCGAASTTAESPPADAPSLATRPLTAEIWKESTAPEKYAPEVLARLRADDSSLRSAANWKKFHREIVVPGFQRDVASPDGPPPE